MTDHYETLGINRNATPEEIKKAYRKLASKNHTDRNHGDNTRMVAINQAHETLSDPEKRKAYDSTGHDGNPNSVEQQAYINVCLLIEQLADALDEDADLLANVRSNISNAIRQIEQKQMEFRAQVRKCMRHIKRIRTKKKGADNLFTRVLNDRMIKLEQGLAELRVHMEVAKRALEMTVEYEEDPEAVDRRYRSAPPPMPQGHQLFQFTTR